MNGVAVRLFITTAGCTFRRLLLGTQLLGWFLMWPLLHLPPAQLPLVPAQLARPPPRPVQVRHQVQQVQVLVRQALVHLAARLLQAHKTMSKYDSLDVIQGRIKVTAVIPTTPSGYYGSEGVVGHDEWIGGEIIYHSGTDQLYVQTATSTTTAVWKRLSTAFATSTTTSTSSSSSTTSSSTSSSSTTTSA